MKSRSLLLALASVSLLSLAGSSQMKTSEVTIQCPSDLRANGARGATSFSLDFVLNPVADFRTMYCAPKALEGLISSNVCLVDFAYDQPFQKLIDISDGKTLSQVLKGTGIRELQGDLSAGEPAVRVVARRAILARDGTDQFLQRRIYAGDIIIVLRVD